MGRNSYTALPHSQLNSRENNSSRWRRGEDVPLSTKGKGANILTCFRDLKKFLDALLVPALLIGGRSLTARRCSVGYCLRFLPTHPTMFHLHTALDMSPRLNSWVPRSQPSLHMPKSGKQAQSPCNTHDGAKTSSQSHFH